MKIKCLIVDDEPLATKLIQNHIVQLDGFEVFATCSNAVSALEILRTAQIDLLFLDIKMPQMTGIDFLKSLKDPPAVIMTTAYREFALDGYDLDIIDYLLKPITFERFFKAIDRYLRSIKPSKVIASIPVYKKHLFLKSGLRHHRLNTDDILYIESLKDNILVVFDDRSITIKFKISELEPDISTLPLIRIHRSFIININKITSFTSNDIVIGGKSISIGPNYKEYVTRKIRNLS